ncbi:hypothetical protein N9917_00920 [Deltaproteobacteria bacterium]|nr:hypothetical protein [Deltaproteobacteria bacterium]
MAKGIIGRPFTFTALFLDGTGAPVAVTTPVIEVFYYDASGVKITLVTAGTVLPASIPTETGRYAYNLCPIPTVLDTSIQLYGIMSGTDPGSGDDLVIEQQVDLFAQSTTADGLRWSFVPPP